MVKNSDQMLFGKSTYLLENRRSAAATHRVEPVGVAEEQAAVGHELRHVRVALRRARLQLHADHVQAHRPRDLRYNTLTILLRYKRTVRGPGGALRQITTDG